MVADTGVFIEHVNEPAPPILAVTRILSLWQSELAGRARWGATFGTDRQVLVYRLSLILKRVEGDRLTQSLAYRSEWSRYAHCVNKYKLFLSCLLR